MSLKRCSLTEISVHRPTCPSFPKLLPALWGAPCGAGCTGLHFFTFCKSQPVCEPEGLSRSKPFPNWSPHCHPLPPSPVTGNGEQRFPPDVSVANQILLQFFIDIVKVGQIFVSLINYNSGLWGELSCLLTWLVGSRVDEGV